jgi:predicted dienelactone hydrolase
MTTLEAFMIILSRLAMVAVLAALALPTQAAGFEAVEIPLPFDQKAEAGICYPSSAPATETRLGPYTVRLARGGAILGRDLPLVIISHGTGGWFGGHHDTAAALADAGFVVAAVTHPGDNTEDQSGFVGQKRFLDRPRHVEALIAFVTADWHGAGRIDPGRIGLFGYSVGAATVLPAAGARPDFLRLRPHCAQHAADPVCAILLPQWAALEGSEVPVAVRRIRAVVLAAPAMGMLFDRESVADLIMPVQVWRASQDRLLIAEHHADRFVRILLGRIELHAVPGAGHYAFLPPCPDGLAKAVPEICRDADGFDRVRFHTDFNREVVRFLSQSLKP